MGDLRNKIRKEIERERVQAMQARLCPPKPQPEPGRCIWCDRAGHETYPLYWIADNPWFGSAIWCDDCLKQWGPPLGLDLKTWEWKRQ